MPKNPIAGLDDLPGYPAWVEVVKTYAKCHRLMSERLAAIDLSVAQHEVLLAVGRNEGLSQNTLARRLLVGKSNVTGLVQRLEARGLLARERDPDDARGRRVLLTTAGRRLLQKATAVQAGVVELMLGGLSEREIERMRRNMRAVGARLDAATSGE